MTAEDVRAGRWRDVWLVHRLEYPFPVHYLCHAVLGACYAVGGAPPASTVAVLLTLLAALLSVVGGNPLNAAVDVATDARTRDKTGIAAAVLRLGRPVVATVAAVEMVGAVVLACAVAAWLGRPLIAVGIAAAVLLCALYNLEPVRLKRRGLANPVVIGLTLGVLPSMATYSAVRPDLPAAVWLVFAGVTVLITGRALWWILPDRAGDRETGIRTPAVAYGALGALALACAVSAAGLALLGWGLWWRYGPLLALLAVLVNSAFLVEKLRLLARRSDRALPSSPQMRHRGLTPVLAADVVLVLLPLAAAVG